jgi:hypothetical protein
MYQTSIIVTLVRHFNIEDIQCSYSTINNQYADEQLFILC